MCGRYTLTRIENLLNYFPWIKDAPPGQPRFDVAPSQGVLVVTNNHAGRFETMHWGLIPSWAKEKSIGSRMINARAETLAEKPAFRTALRRRRCLIPADGFFEWRREPDGKTKTPIYFRMKSAEPFAFAGLWDVWHSPDGSVVPSCTVITGAPNELVAPIHDRMPAILPREQYERWLDPNEQDAGKMATLLGPYPAEEMEAYAVSRVVNSPKSDSPDNVKPAVAESLF